MRTSAYDMFLRDALGRALAPAHLPTLVPRRHVPRAGFLPPLVTIKGRDFWDLGGGRLVPAIGGHAANTAPLFALVPNIGFATVTAANTATDGTGTVATIFTAGTNLSRVDRLRLVPLGTNAASKAYIFINNGGAQGTAANNALVIDIPLPGTTASNTLLIGAPVEIAVAWALKAAFVINVTLATAVAAGWKFTALGADY